MTSNPRHNIREIRSPRGADITDIVVAANTAMTRVFRWITTGTTW